MLLLLRTKRLVYQRARAALSWILPLDEVQGETMNTNAGYVTTHVLDTSLGKPASELKIDVSRFEHNDSLRLRVVTTNSDGRCDHPVIRHDEMSIATFELLFYAGEYLDRIHGRTKTPRFLDRIPVRFTIDDPTQHYHVPLLLSPYGYSTYRGS